MKLPFIQLYPADLRSDPNLSRCSISARGVWFEFLMVMHMNDHCGLISGTREELARDARCTVVELSSAIIEFDTTKTADVTERNGVVTVINRRMRREWEARKKGALRAKRYRNTHSVTPQERESSLIASSSMVSGISENGGAGERQEPVFPTVKEIADYCAGGIGIPADYCEHYHATKTIRNGWIVNGQLIQWKLEIPRWWAKDRPTWFQRSKNANNSGFNKPNPRNVGLAGDQAERTKRVLETIARRQDAAK